METLFYNLQNIIINFKKLNNLFKKNKITDFHFDLVKFYIYYHKTQKLIDINSKIDLLLEDIKSLEITNKYYPIEYKNFILYEKYKNQNNILLLIHPCYYYDIIDINNIIFQKKIIFNSKIKYNNLLQQLYPNDGFLIEKTNRYYSENPLRLLILSELPKINIKKYYISKDYDINEDILKILLDIKSLDNNPELTYRMKYDISSIKSDKDHNCFIIIDDKIEYINIDDEIESIEMPYYKRKNIIYNPIEYYYYKGYKFIYNNKKHNI